MNTMSKLSGRIGFSKSLSAVIAGSMLVASPAQWLFAEELQRVANVTEQPADNRMIIRNVRNLVEEGHISQPKFNDEMSKRGFALFLKQVDPLKGYLLQADVDEFRQQETNLDDMLLKNNISFAYAVYKRYLQRLNEVMPLVHELIDTPHDYNVEEFLESDAKTIPYAKDMSELQDRWRKTI